MALYSNYGLHRREGLSAKYVAARAARRDFWRREARYFKRFQNKAKSVTILLIVLFFTVFVWEHAEFFYSRRAVLWELLAGILLSVPVTLYIFRD